MWKTIWEHGLLWGIIGCIALAGVAGKCVFQMKLKKLVKEAGNMSKSAHPFLRLVRAKYEHAFMVNDRVQNVEVFVDKYIQEYKLFGMSLYKWTRWTLYCALLCTVAGMFLCSRVYQEYGAGINLIQTATVLGAVLLFLFLVQGVSGEKQIIKQLRVYMVDYLENVYARRMEKEYKKEQKTESVEKEKQEKQAEPVVEKMEKKEPKAEKKVEKPEPKERVIREILEEFLA